MSKSKPVRLQDMTLGDYLRWLATALPDSADMLRDRAKQADALGDVEAIRAAIARAGGGE